MSKIILPDRNELANFLVKAKKNVWAGDANEVEPRRPGFKRHVFREGVWLYEDKYSGFYRAPGSEFVSFNDVPTWFMYYSGGMKPYHLGDEEFAKQTFSFLKEMLLMVDRKMPFRGPTRFEKGEWLYYIKDFNGDIYDFRATEVISYKGGEAFTQDFGGGVIIDK